MRRNIQGTKPMTYKGMIIQHDADGFCWHDGTAHGEYGGYWPTLEACKEDIDFVKANGRGY
jgi:hypothetical protein